jgi:hypothetical protein
VPVVTGASAPIGLAISPSCLYFGDFADGQVGTGSIQSHDLD